MLKQILNASFFKYRQRGIDYSEVIVRMSC